MGQRSLHWDGSTLGDAGVETVVAADGIGYRLANEDYESPLVDVAFRMLWNGDENRGVLANWTNELQVTVAVAPNQVDVDTGGAIVYGMPYQNTSAVNVAIPTPTNDTRIDRVVLRRNWADQEIRVTRIIGAEGGGVPAMTQSPAPSGSGIYDIPLAQVSIDTLANITVTDEREYCQFGMGIRDDGIGTTQITNSSIDWTDRATTTKRKLLGAQDFQPLTAGDQWLLGSGATLTISNTATWNGGANTQGWQFNGVTYEGVYGSFSLPPDYVTGTAITSNLWYVANAAIAHTAYLRSEIGVIASNTHSYYYTAGTSASSYISGTPVVSDWYRVNGAYITTMPTGYFPPPGGVPLEDMTLLYLAYWYNSAGLEDISLMAVELVYTGYV